MRQRPLNSNSSSSANGLCAHGAHQCYLAKYSPACLPATNCRPSSEQKGQGRKNERRRFRAPLLFFPLRPQTQFACLCVCAFPSAFSRVRVSPFPFSIISPFLPSFALAPFDSLLPAHRSPSFAWRVPVGECTTESLSPWLVGSLCG